MVKWLAQASITAISPLCDEGAHVLVVQAHDKQFCLLVEQVIGLCHVEANEIEPRAPGPAQQWTSGTVRGDGEPIIDVDALAE